MRSRRVWISILGGLIVYGGAVLLLFGIWVLSFIVLARFNLSDQALETAIFFCFFVLAPFAAMLWWSYSKYRWKIWLNYNPSDYEQQDLNVVIASTEAFLIQQVPEIIHEFKMNFPEFDTSIIGEIEFFLPRFKIPPTSRVKQPDTDGITARIDELIGCLQKSMEALKGQPWEQTREWQFVVYELTIKLKQLKLALH